MVRILAAVVLVALVPPEKKAVELKYRFEKGLKYREVQRRQVETEVFTKDGTVREKLAFEVDITRTILESDRNSHPMSERVEVRVFRRNILSTPSGQTGPRPYACEGKTFVWKRLKERWGLFGDSEEVTVRHTQLVEHLKNWRDARLPKQAVGPGDTWQVKAAQFLRTAGLKVPDNVTGMALYKLDKIEDKGIARISFRIRFQHLTQGYETVVDTDGKWSFDVGKGRDLESSLDGIIQLNKGKTGKGKVTITRKVSYP
ncbi:MAG: hypothetical protein ACYSUN_08525 [Planctomycetota bacterium]|jgi:hypothetical protein